MQKQVWLIGSVNITEIGKAPVPNFFFSVFATEQRDINEQKMIAENDTGCDYRLDF